MQEEHLVEHVEYYRTFTRVIAASHVVHKKLLSMKLNSEFRGQEFLAVYSETMYNYLEQTHGRADAQMSQPQTLSYLQEAVSMDSELNQLRHTKMIRRSQGKGGMDLTQYMDALDDLAVLARKPDGRTDCQNSLVNLIILDLKS
jgi:hypothetical protein